MKKYLVFGGLMVLMFLSLVKPIEAGVPALIHYQGKLTHTGSPVTGNQEVGFKIFDAEIGGNCLWAGTYTVSCSNGLFWVILGSGMYPINPSVLIDKDALCLELVVGGTLLAPRQSVASVIFSFMAQQAGTATYALNADKLDGKELQELEVGTATYAYKAGTATYAETAGATSGTASQRHS